MEATFRAATLESAHPILVRALSSPLPDPRLLHFTVLLDDLFKAPPLLVLLVRLCWLTLVISIEGVVKGAEFTTGRIKATHQHLERVASQDAIPDGESAKPGALSTPETGESGNLSLVKRS